MVDFIKLLRILGAFMCGRYISNSEDEVMEIREILKQISMRFVVADYDNAAALTDIYPTNKVLIINNSVETIYSKWGIEKWDKKGVIINARSETYEKSGFFKNCASNRCIVPAHGYYEWQTLPDKKKVKYAFTNKKAHGIFMAGIYRPKVETDKQELGGEALDFAIITKPAEKEIQFIHNRMPMIIQTEQVGDWLNGKLSVSEVCSVNSGIVYEETG
jgi:putative SOS response-associated peptidase YedK